MKKHLIASLLGMAFALPHAQADDAASGPSVKISGFGTGALTWTNTNDATFGRANQAIGADKDPTTGVDSNLGLQADVGINNWLSLTAQGLVRKDTEDSFGAELMLAFAKARLSDQWSLRVGRVGLPIFMISDYRNVGYANTMLRPPIELYNQVVFNSVDGADLSWQHSFGATSVTAQLAVGKLEVSLPGPIHMEARDVRALNLVAEHGPLTMRVGHARARINVDDSADMNMLLSTLRAVGSGYGMQQINALADAVSVNRKDASFTSAGLTLDWNDIVVQGEYAKRKTDSYINDTTSWYLMTGYRIGAFLPYVVHATTKVDGTVPNTMPAACPAGYPAACTPTMQALHAGVDALASAGGQGEQLTNAIGVRWDFHRSMALKVQFDRVKPRGGIGFLATAKPGFNRPVTVGAVALDFVF